MVCSSAPTSQASQESTFTDADWHFLDAPALVNALTDLPLHGTVRMTSAPSEEEKAAKRVMDALGKLVRHGAHPPMGWYRTPEDPRRPFLLTQWYATVLHRPEDGLAVLVKYPRRDEETAEQLVQRCLYDEDGSVDGSMHLGRLTRDGRSLSPWIALNADRLIAWDLSSGKDQDYRHGLADLSASLRRGGLRKAYQAWEQTQLLDAVSVNEALTVNATARRRTGRRL